MKKAKTQIYKSQKNGQFGWRLIAKNGKKVACSGETFYNKKDCIKSAKSISRMLVESEFIDTTTKK